MAGVTCASYHNKNNSRLTNTFLQKTSTLYFESKIPNPLLERNGGNNTVIDTNERFRTCGPWSRFYVSNIPNSQKRRLNPSDFQLKKAKQIPKSFEISSDKYAQNSIFSATIRLANKNRFVERIFPCSNRRSPQTLSSFDLQRPSTANVLPTVRNCVCPKNICFPHELGRTDNERQRLPCSSLFRRFLHCQSKPGTFTKTGTGSCPTSTTIRVASELRKINIDTTKSYRVSRNRLGSAYQQQILTGPKMQSYKAENRKVISAKESKLKTNTKHSRFPEFCQFSGNTRSTQSSSSSKTLPKPPLLSEATISNSSRSPRRTMLVAGEHFKQVVDTFPARVPLPSNRCIRVSMGGTSGQHESLGTVASKPVCSPLESTRTTGSVLRFKRSLSLPDKLITPDSERQQDSCGISKKRGRYEVPFPNERMLQNFSNIGSLQYSYRSSLSSGAFQPRSRPFVPTISSTRVAPTPSDNEENISQVGNTTDRSLCISDSTRRSHLCIPGCDGPSSSSTRLFQPDLVLQTSMAIPSSIPNTPSTSSPQYSYRDVHTGSPSLAESILETRSTEPRPGCSIHDSQPCRSSDRYSNRATSTSSPRHDPGSMDMWGWSESLVHWSQEQKDLLFSCWRKSSLKTYKPAWERWTTWSKGNSVNTFKPSGSELARFLIDLYQNHNLSYSTILVYKSAVSTLCDPNSDSRLSSHVLVKHALKAIRNKNPKIDKAPIWDTDCLKIWLQNTPVNEKSLFECSKRAAILLLLCSGRRVHDLSLLSIDSDSFIVSENSITLWPKFGSKTDSGSNRQSGWKLLENKDSKALDPTLWLKKVIFLSAERRNICKSNNLFLTASGPPKAATPTVIANWVKKVLMDAGIKASPGSVRSAVASKNWVQDCPLEEILARGNWRSQNTFTKYYCRVIQPADPLSSTSSCFIPIR